MTVPHADADRPRADDAPPAPSEADRAPVGAARRARRWPLVVVTALAVAVAIGAAVIAARAASDDPQVDLRRAAGSFGELLVTYDHRDPQRHRDAVLEQVTSSFAGEYERAFDQGLGQLIEQLEATSRGFVKDVFTTDVARGQALAIVVLDVETSGTTGPRRLFDVYVRLTMIQVDGQWLVDDVTDLSFGSGGSGPVPPGVTEGAPASPSTSLP